MRVLAIDQGTTSTRAIALENGRTELVHSVLHKQIHPQPNWVEHDPLELLANVRSCLEAAGSADIIGLDNQGESCLAWDAETGEPLSPVIVWQDARTAAEIEKLKRAGAEEITLDRAGLLLDSYFSASKLAWILQNVSQARSLARSGRLRLGTTDAFFLQHLTGHCATDVTTASRTSLMNLASGAWDDELCRLFGVPIAALPPILPTVSNFGSTRCGSGHAEIRCNVVDQQAALYGHGCRRAGDAKVTFGTGAFALVLTGGSTFRRTEEGLLPTIAWQIGKGSIQYALDGGVYNAGSALDWGRGLGLFNDFSEIGSFEGPPAIERKLIFVPALSGLACPHWDRSAAGLWLGMSLSTSRLDLVRAILEGVGLRIAEVLTAMESHVGLSSQISIDGGLSRNGYFCQFLADVSGRVVRVPRMPELTAFGCARLAVAEAEEDTSMPHMEARTFSPRSSQHEEWKATFAEAVKRAKAWRV